MNNESNGHVEERRKMISEAFHTLNQPLTGLHCGLEIALQKPRSEGEYRKRIGDGIENAGAILKLVKAVRQLVDSADPGERFGTLDLSLVMSQLKTELEVVAEATNVGLEVNYSPNARVQADPGKLLAALGGLAAARIEDYEPGGAIRIDVNPQREMITIAVDGSGAHKDSQNTAEKLRDIRRDAALSYLWTIGGTCEITSDGWEIKLPAVK